MGIGRSLSKTKFAKGITVKDHQAAGWTTLVRWFRFDKPCRLVAWNSKSYAQFKTTNNCSRPYWTIHFGVWVLSQAGIHEPLIGSSCSEIFKNWLVLVRSENCKTFFGSGPVTGLRSKFFKKLLVLVLSVPRFLKICLTWSSSVRDFQKYFDPWIPDHKSGKEFEKKIKLNLPV